MNYKVRPGIVMTKICGSTFLIPTRPASVFCPHILRMSFLTTVCWEMLSHEKPIDAIYTVYRILSKRPLEEARDKVDALLRDLCEKGYLIPVEDDAP